MRRIVRPALFVLPLLLCLTGALPSAGWATDLYKAGDWPSLATDQIASKIGDSVTVVIYEDSTATNTTQKSKSRGGHIAGQVSAGSSVNESGQITAAGGLDSTGQTGRAGKMVAQISVVVDAILTNGDLHVAGEQYLNINGERTHIRLKGRVRRNDITTANTVLSTRLSDVSIDYDGSGFVAQGSRAPIASRIFHWLGL
jgi:flagellar L-ring protein precursor FlgH